MAFPGSFGKQSGPNSKPQFGNVAPSPSPSPYPSPPTPPFFNAAPLRSTRPFESSASPNWDDGQTSFFRNNDTHFQQRPSSVTSLVASRNPNETSVTLRVVRSQDGKKTHSSLMSRGEENLRNSYQGVPRRNSLSIEGFRPPPVGAGPVRQFVPPRTHSPEMASKNNHTAEGFHPFFVGPAPVRPAPSSHSLDGWAKSTGNYVNFQARQDQSSVSPYMAERGRVDDVQLTSRTRSPTPPSGNEISNENPHSPQNNSKRPSFSPSPASSAISNVDFSTHDSQAPRRSSPQANNALSEAAATNPTGFPAMKRSRSPPLLSSNQASKENSYGIQEADREMQAKARRLARFKTELGNKEQSSIDNAEKKVLTNRHEPSIVGRNKLIAEHSTELAEEVASGIASSEYENLRPSSVIIGLCTDMCPESERTERERKGDLDQFERLDGDRNQTSKYLAVKKYTRTAEREANLIRPMPVLQETIDYLLNLLDQPYNDRFLGIYNFLWDRMRAVRMDLRMQHIFNQGAISMLEQMIRLHIIAMHELCEYSKGEGFSEGFDAHLNIEQMNKTSVELFQMYDDHRKRGVAIPAEKEFRGYYALLKLDKHPGYIVEPAELSLDLAKMTPEIRQTKEVLFARDVARACRTGNFIAFFRLARKASYLQACLMHAHFAKLRTQALASLHAGLQNNQGLPVMHVAKWLAMEEEDMESLLEYHGFLIKVFEEPYMVKEGPFLNVDKDYPTRCSKLVDMKKSGMIMKDVLPSSQVISPTKAPLEFPMAKTTNNEFEVFPSDERERSLHDIPSLEVFSPVHVVDDEMADSEAIPSPKEHKQMHSMTEMPIVNQQCENEHQVAGFYPLSWGFLPKPLPGQVGNEGKSNYQTSFSISPQRNMQFGGEEIQSQLVSKTAVQDVLPDAPYNCAVENSGPKNLVNMLEEEPQDVLQENESADVLANNQHEEVAEAKLKLTLRLWRRRTSRKRELREQRQLAANAALNSLQLGPPVQLKRNPPSTSSEFDIDHVLRERYTKHEQSWSRLNVSEETSLILSGRNPHAKCLCWKILICSPKDKPEECEMGKMSQTAHLAISQWLLSKLMSSNKDDADDLVISSHGLSIWKKWVPGQSCSELTCCLSVVKDADFSDLIETVSGASAVLFLVCDSIPWNLQKARLHKLLMSIPFGSCLPLLILSSSYKDKVSDPTSVIVNELGLLDIDKSRISRFLVASLIENRQMECFDEFFSDNRLREGLRWLASESPPQLVLHCVKTRELVLTHLNPSLEALDSIKDYELDPNDFILAFNEAIDQSLVDIDAAAKANCTSWPCPEIALLEEFSNEHRFVEWCIPENGWSSVEKTKSLMSALWDCKLPPFCDDLSYLVKGSNAGWEIEIQKEEFEKSLIRYLTGSSKLLGSTLAIKEARTMLQISRLELRGSCFHIVPNWVMIFKRIFNWRLTTVAGGAFSSTYILNRPNVTPAFRDNLGLESSSGLSPYYVNQPSLDEMIEVSCSPLSFSKGQPLAEVYQVLPQMALDGEAQLVTNTSDFMEDDSGVDWDHRVAVADNTIGEVRVAGKVNEEAERLSKLLEKCNMLQNMIDEKLSVYF